MNKTITLDKFIEEEKARDPKFKNDFDKGYAEFLLKTTKKERREQGEALKNG
jgi:hypothetical protein